MPNSWFEIIRHGRRRFSWVLASGRPGGGRQVVAHSETMFRSRKKTLAAAAAVTKLVDSAVVLDDTRRDGFPPPTTAFSFVPGVQPLIVDDSPRPYDPVAPGTGRVNVGATGEWWTLQPYIIALYTSNAAPLLPDGQKFDGKHFLPEDDHNTGRSVTGRWKILNDRNRRTLQDLHSSLARIRRDHPALRSTNIWPYYWDDKQTHFNREGAGIDVARQLVIYHRWARLDTGVFENFVIVLNFSDITQNVTVPFPVDGQWADQLAGFDGHDAPWTVDVKEFSDDTGFHADIPVGSHWGRVLLRTVPGRPWAGYPW